MRNENELKKIGDALGHCSLCGLCQAVCPAYATSGRDTDSPRGLVLLLRGYISGHVKIQSIRGQLENCILCGKCSRACPRNIPLDKIIASARCLATRGPRISQWPFYALSKLPPPILDKLQYLLALYQEYLPKALKKISLKLPTVARKPFSGGVADGNNEDSAPKVLLFGGCIARRVFPNLGRACALVLRRHGFNVVIDDKLVCCGRGHYTTGRKAPLLAAAKRNLAIIARHSPDYVVTPCPACLATLSSIQDFIDELNSAQKERARRLAGIAFDINDFIACKGQALENIKDAPRQSIKKIWWHQPCLMTENQAIAAKSILNRSGNYEVCPTSLPCCGSINESAFSSASDSRFRGSATTAPLRKIQAGVSHRESENFHERIILEVREQLLAEGANTIVVPCPGCMLKLRQVSGCPGDAVEVLHPVEMYAEYLEKQ